MSYEVGWKICEEPDAAMKVHEPHLFVDDYLLRMAMESKELGNSRVKEKRFKEAIAHYSEVIMHGQQVETNAQIQWGTGGKKEPEERKYLRHLMATAYLNLSLCFLKENNLENARSAATKALEGDASPVNPDHDVLEHKLKAKAYMRRGLAEEREFAFQVSDFEKSMYHLKKWEEELIDLEENIGKNEEEGEVGGDGPRRNKEIIILGEGEQMSLKKMRSDLKVELDRAKRMDKSEKERRKEAEKKQYGGLLKTKRIGCPASLSKTKKKKCPEREANMAGLINVDELNRTGFQQMDIIPQDMGLAAAFGLDPKTMTEDQKDAYNQLCNQITSQYLEKTPEERKELLDSLAKLNAQQEAEFQEADKFGEQQEGVEGGEEEIEDDTSLEDKK